MIRLGKILFQFHKGTIKTKKELEAEQDEQVFQFHKGTIKTRNRTCAQPYQEISIP